MDKYTVYEVADILKTSHTTIYNNLNNKDIYKELKKFIIKQAKLSYVSAEGVKVLKKYINFKETDNKLTDEMNEGYRGSVLENAGTVTRENLQQIDSKLVVEFREMIKSLENQLVVKDSQIESLLRKSENSQVLLKQHQDKILLPEEPKHEGEKRWFRRWFG